MKTTTIIVDDHSLFNDGLRLILKETEDFEVIEQIYDSRQAFTKCVLLTPQLIMMDYNMPHLNGLQVVQQLKNIQYPKKIVIVSMYADKKEISLFQEAGVEGYLPKTTPAELLVDSLRKIMAGKKVFEASQTKKPNVIIDAFSKLHQLTKREIEILNLVKKNYTSEQIAETLHLSYYTIETHRKNINLKLNFGTKREFYDFLEQL
jgi:DNA-binding NarL/FixJ family response regulator